ncbi:MAG TPA: DUF308 domain-containing protein [Rhodopila sp.]|uniref:HdeD family acid-resistance protein n=1 Tax=Rhodopila sp. TaxID=2480087 RepID=UPI002BBBA3E6|nr:DUF308 domain-containing protein [Rhodopila sp.]HVY14790.1 DUF308 domain-containing protein [Rhodopila sp.]
MRTGFVFIGAASAHDLVRHWWLFALRGVFALLFGILAILAPDLTLTSLLVVFAAYMLLDGVLSAASAFTAAFSGHPWGALAIEAVLCLVTAALVVMWPGLSLLVAVIVIGVWAIFTGAALLATSLRFGLGAWPMGLAAVVSIVIGVLVLIEPITGALVLATWLGIYALLFGLMLLGMAWRLRRIAHHPR